MLMKADGNRRCTSELNTFSSFCYDQNEGIYGIWAVLGS